MSTLLQLTDQNFDEEVLRSEMPVIVDFWAPWCGPCRAIGPIVEDIAKEYSGKIKVGKFNVDDSTEVPAKYLIRSIPTLLFFKDGQVSEQLIGAVPKGNITKIVDELI